MPTSTITQEAEGDRIELKNLSSEATGQLAQAGMDKRGIVALTEVLEDLVADVDEIARRVFAHAARALAVRRDDIPGGGPVAAILRYPV